MAEIEVKGTFNAQAFFTALAAILSKRERVKIWHLYTSDAADDLRRCRLSVIVSSVQLLVC